MAQVPSTRTFSEVAHLPAYFDGLPKIAERFHLLCLQGDQQPGAGKGSVFNSSEPAAMSVNDFLVRLCKYGHCSPQCFVVMTIYAERFMKRTGFVVSSRSVQRVLLAAFILAAKMRDDVYYTNAYYGTIGGIHNFKVNLMEMTMLQSLDWAIDVSALQYEAQCDSISGGQQEQWARRRSSAQLPGALESASLDRSGTESTPGSSSSASSRRQSNTPPPSAAGRSGRSSLAAIRGGAQPRKQLRQDGHGLCSASAPQRSLTLAEKRSSVANSAPRRRQTRELAPHTDDMSRTR